MAKANKKQHVSNAQKLGIGVGLTTAAVAAAGAYFLYGSKDAPENRKKVKSGILKAKAEVLEALENAEHISEEEFHQLVNNAVNTYGKLQSVSKKDIADFKREMKDNWEVLVQSGIAKVLTPEQMATKKAVKKKAKKTAKKSTKKTAKKSTKKTAKKAAKKTAKKKK